MSPAQSYHFRFMSRVVVVEATAPERVALSTAHHAMEQSREVFAVPGPVDSLATEAATACSAHALKAGPVRRRHPRGAWSTGSRSPYRP